MAVCVARYCAVFPISKAINIFYRARGHRTDELPHSYQMMLFWAGLRGAVGVALAAGMKGENAVALRTTVLVTVVLTVVVFGGTIGRMIEILGIRTGVEEENEDSSDEEGAGNGGGYGMVSGDGEESARPSKKSKRRSFGNGIRGGKYSAGMEMERDELDQSTTTINMSDRFRDTSSNSNRNTSSDGTTRMTLGSVPPRHAAPSTSRLLSATPDQSSDEESDSEVLPNVSSEVGVEKEGDLTRVWRDGQWFTVLDERYLLPVFSNATASRRQASRKALKAKRQSFAADRNENPLEEDGLASLPGTPSLLSPKINNGTGAGKRREFNGSFSDILSSLVGPALSSPSTISPSPSPSHFAISQSQSQQQSHKRHDSSENFDDAQMESTTSGSIDLSTMPSTVGSGMSHSRSRRSSPPLGIGGAGTAREGGSSSSSSLSGGNPGDRPA